jgi:nicotinamide riboside kinase
MAKIWISSIRFSDGSTYALDQNDIVVFVGPNNSGKSKALQNLSSKIQTVSASGEVIAQIHLGSQGTEQECYDYIRQNTAESTVNGQVSYKWIGNQGTELQIKALWANRNFGINFISSFFTRLLQTDDRLTLAQRVPPIDPDEAPSHPLHYIFTSNALAQRLDTNFKNAFGVQLVRRLKISKNLLLHVGNDPIAPGEDRVSDTYIAKLDQLPFIDTQGDGMRAFAGLLIHSVVPHYSLMMIDEPEAFLHPPQARYLGRAIVNDVSQSKQLFLATHSGDILRGILDTNSSKVHVIRLQRDSANTSINHAKLLNKADINQIWSAPILRYSNVLDGLFHERVIVCESDADCTFYSAVTDWLYETQYPTIRKPDVMFIHAGGIPGMNKIVRSLLPLSVPTSVIADFDVLNKNELQQISTSLGATWTTINQDRQKVVQAINALPPAIPEVAAVRVTTTAELDAIQGQYITPHARDRIIDVVSHRSPWVQAKKYGRALLTSPASIASFDNMVAYLTAHNIFVVPTGELESFCLAAASSNSHSASWLTKVFEDTAKKAQAFTAASGLIKQIFNLP